jgi:hypothetical protein
LAGRRDARARHNGPEKKGQMEPPSRDAERQSEAHSPADAVFLQS